MVYRLLLICVGLLVLSSCGGGSGGDSAPPEPTPTPDPGPNWQAGVFPSSNSYFARCETPRTGIDPFENAPYPDMQGTVLQEKLFLRSWTYETYLWFDEVPDNNPDNFSLPEYFDQLKTDELTSSGKPKDNFHFSQNTALYRQQTQSGVTSGYGFEWERTRSSAPRSFTIRYTEPSSPAAIAGVPRGAQLLTVDGIDFVNAATTDEVAAINAGLFPSQPGSTHEFGFQLVDGTQTTVTLVSANIDIVAVQNVKVIDTPAGRTGYLQFNRFITPSQDALVDAFNQFVDEGVNELVIDLRYNGGGRLALASQLAYMIAGPAQTGGRTFELSLNNGKFGSNEPLGFYDREIDYDRGVFLDTRLPSPGLSRVFVLSTLGTCSASESVINGLRGIDVEVVLIGDTTCGKPFGFFPQDNCGTTYFTIQFQSTNDKGFGAYQDGFVPTESPVFDDQLPGCFVEDDFSQPLGDESEALLATAIHYMSEGACPLELSNQSQSLNTLSRVEATTDNRRSAKRRQVILDAIIDEQRSPIREP